MDALEFQTQHHNNYLYIYNSNIYFLILTVVIGGVIMYYNIFIYKFILVCKYDVCVFNTAL